ncbi:MAG TPA: ABC transporter permease [Vicinamibacterales bacterium]|nr:ABC transporter permease [Vicinamibacterales bacterium]
MTRIIALASKDLRLLARNKGRLFFTFVWPLIVTVLFGLAFGGGGTQQSKIKVAIVDEDNSDGSRALASRLEESFAIAMMDRTTAEHAVRRGERSGYIVLTPGLGAAAARPLVSEPARIEIGVEPARQTEAGMMHGLVIKHAAAAIQQRLGGGVRFWQPFTVITTKVMRERRGPANAFDVTFAQGAVWGLIGCMMSFGVSLVTERTRGTLVRLRMAPLTRAHVLGGKAAACFTSMVLVELLLLAVAWGLGVRPTSIALLAVAGVSAAICFVGFMMLVAGVGRSEETASGAGWALLMPFALFGGAMVPTFVMPQWMQTIGYGSPIRWAILAIEGGVWRDFSAGEMAMPCALLVGVGVMCFAAGTRTLRDG